MANNVSIKISAKDEASGSFDRLQSKIDRLGPTGLAKDFLTGAIMGGGIAAAGMLTSSVGSVVGSLGDLAAAAREDEASTAKLTAAIEANDAAWSGNLSQVEKAIATGQDLAFTDDDVRDSLTRLVTSTRDANEAVRLNALAMDLARLKGMDLEQAANLVAKAHDGQIGALTKAGISMDGVKTSTEALARIEEAAAGQAETFAATGQGAFERLAVKADELGEKIGGLVAGPMEGLVNIASDLIDELTTADESKWAPVAEMAEDLEYLGAAAKSAWGPTAAWGEAAEDAVTNTSELAEKMRGVLRFSEEAYDDGVEVAVEFGLGVADGSDSANAAVIALRKRMESEMDTGAQIARWKGFLTGSELADGLNSADPRVREAAEQAKAEAEKQLALLEQDAKDYGYNTGLAWADGMDTSKTRIAESAARAVAAAKRVFAASSPPGPESPLHEIDIWGMRTGEAWADGLVSGINTALTEIPAALAGVAALVPGATLPTSPREQSRPPEGWQGPPAAVNVAQGLAPNGMTWEEFYWGPGAQNRNISEYGFSGGNLPSATPTVNVVVQGGLVDDATAERIANAVMRPLQRACRVQGVSLVGG